MEFDKKTERILDIYFRLSKGMVLNKKELADSYGVNPRSIQRDLDDIRCYLANNGEYGTELVYDREAKGFRLIRTDINTLSNSQMLTVCKILIESRALVKEEMEPIIRKLLNNCVPYNEYDRVSQLISNELYHSHHSISFFQLAVSYPHKLMFVDRTAYLTHFFNEFLSVMRFKIMIQFV